MRGGKVAGKTITNKVNAVKMAKIRATKLVKIVQSAPCQGNKENG